MCMGIRTILILCADCDAGFRLAQIAGRSDHRAIAGIRKHTEAARYHRLGADTARIDPTDRADVDSMFAELDPDGLAVISVLGGTPQMNTQGNLNVINAAHAAGVERFLLVSSIGCGDSAGAVDEFVKVFVGKALTAKTWAERQLQTTDMDWTIVRAGGMLRRNFKGGAILIDSNTVSGHISPIDLGDAVFRALVSDKTTRRVLAAVDAEDAYETSGREVIAADI